MHGAIGHTAKLIKHAVIAPGHVTGAVAQLKHPIADERGSGVGADASGSSQKVDTLGSASSRIHC